MNPINWFPGYKTYIVAVGGACTALGAFLSGDMSLGPFVEAMFMAATAITIRKGVKNGG